MTREVFPNAPLQLVAFEATFSDDGQGGDADLLAGMVLALPGASQTQFAPAGLLRERTDGQGFEAPLFRIIGRDHTLAVTVWRRALVVEETNYTHFEDYCATLTTILTACDSVRGERAVSRIGLRYVDEVHVPHAVHSLEDWRPYVHPALVWPADLFELPADGMSSAFSVPLGEANSMNVRTAVLPGPALQTDNAVLRLRPRPDTPAFVLDCDASHVPSPDPQTYSPAQIVDILGALRAATHSMFGRVFTDRARESFREVPA